MFGSKPVCKPAVKFVLLGVLLFPALLHLLSTSSLAKWNSFPVSYAEITSIAVDPGNADTVYAGTRSAGVFKTTNAGTSWAPARGGLTFYPIRSLAVNPVNTNVIYAGTDYDGVWKSTDGGTTWVKTSNGLADLIVFRLIIDPGHPDTIYAALGGGVALSIGNIYKSVNGGLTWERKDNGIASTEDGKYTQGAVEMIALDPDTPAQLYTATIYFSGVFASSDGGETWTPLNKNLDFEAGVQALAVDRHHGGRPAAVFSGKAAASEKTGYYIYDNLNGWQKVSVDYGPMSPSYLYFHPLNPNIIYACGWVFEKSADGGLTWINAGGNYNYFGDIAFHPAKPDTIYAAYYNYTAYKPNSKGVYKSSDQGATWSFASSGITGAVVRSVAIDPTSHGIMYFGSDEGYLARTQDGGQTWQQCPIPQDYGDPQYTFGLGITDIRIAPAKPSDVYVAGSNLYKSSDRGLTFTRIDEIENPLCIVIDPLNSNIIYTSEDFGSGIKKSLDGGQSWQLLQNGLPDISVFALAIDPSQPSTIWAGTDRGYSDPNSGIYQSVDGGATWQAKLKRTDGGDQITALTVHPRNSNVVLAGIETRYGGKIVQSSDGGETWQEKCSGIGTPYAIIFDPRNPRTLYAAAEGTGVLRSLNGGNTWSLFNDGIYYPNVYSLAANKDPHFLIAGSYGSGLYYSTSLSNPQPLPGLMLLLE